MVSTPNQFVNGLWYKNLAGGSADSTLSVGSDTVKRTITNVAAGRMNASSTDAINGSQLFKTKEELINKGMKFGADSGNVINKKTW